MKRTFSCLTLAALIAVPTLAQSGGEWIETGVRGGWFKTRAHENLSQSELYAIRTLRWSWTTRSGWNLQTGLEISAGAFRGPGQTTAIGAAGPILRIRRGDARWSVDIGSRPTLIGHNDFGSKAFGGPFQFTSHGALNIDMGDHITIGFRFHHMSNARLYRDNEGTNMQSIQVGWRF